MSMAKKKTTTQHIGRLAATLAASFPTGEFDGGHGYELSSAFALAEKRRLAGEWQVVDHQVDGEPYTRHFIATILRGAELLEPDYQSGYHFMDGVCVRRTEIRGTLLLPDGHPKYCYRMCVSLQWELEPQCLLIRPVMGYQYASLDEAPAAVKELAASGEWQRIGYRFDGDELLVSDAGDEKRLRRVQ
jgi:hypothetical protein